MFSARVNPVTGKVEWVAQERDARRDVTSEESDLSPELARSQYGDMLHDTIRVGLPAETVISTEPHMCEYFVLLSAIESSLLSGN